MSAQFEPKHGLLLVALGISALMPASATAAWTFGIIGDTQWAPQTDENRTVAIHVIDQVNQQFIAHGVDIVLAVGDLHDTMTPTAIQVRKDRNKPLADAGIPFYPVRGNHDDERRALTAYKAAFDMSAYSTPTFGADGQAAKGLSYAFTHENAKFVLIDRYQMPNGKYYTVADHQPWIDSELAADDHQHAFVMAHANLQGQNHKDNVFGGSPDANPSMQNAFIDSLDRNGVRYYFSGHDHMHHRSVVTSPDGRSQTMQIISASDSFKFYDPEPPYSAREQNVAHELNTIGYNIYTVDGPRVTGQFYSSPVWWTQSDGADGSPTWTLRESFGYSLNGQQFLVQPGQTFAGIQDNAPSGAGWLGTRMAILAGDNDTWSVISGNRATVQDVNTGWSQGQAGLASDVVSLWGMQDGLGTDQGDTYALSLSFDGNAVDADMLAQGKVFLAYRDSNGSWVKAVEGNHGGGEQFVLGAYDPTYGLGTYGVDPVAGTAWAVINYGSDFAVAAVPEPGTWAMLLAGLGLVGSIAGRRRADSRLN